MAERHVVTSNNPDNSKLETAEFEKIQILNGTEAELETKNGGGSPMDTGELAVSNDTEELWHRFSGPDVRKIPFLDGSGNARGSNALDLQSSRSVATQVASADNAVAVGSNNTASGSNSNAIGYYNTASGYNSSAIGYSNDASTYYSSAIGYNNTASGYLSSAIGYFNTASANYSSAIGCQTKTTIVNTQELGYWSNSTTRAGAVRVHGTGMVALTAPVSDTAFTASAAANGSEADGSLATGMLAHRIGSTDNELITEVNKAGTIYQFSAPKIEPANGNAISIGDLGGNARGSGSVTIQASRSIATQVASGGNSVAIGSSVTASGNYATVLGYNANASGSYANATGYNAEASSYYATAVGYFATASGSTAIALGFYANASSNFTVAIGKYATASGNNATASGTYATASGSSATASGYNATASGNSASATGYNATASGSYANALGYYATASQTNSGAFGFRAKSATANAQELGYWSNSTTRAGAVRVHGTGMVALTLQNRATEYGDGGATAGSEADNTLIREGYAIRRDGDDLYIDVNIGGTVKTLSLGTAV